MFKVVWIDRNHYDVEEYIKSFHLTGLIEAVIFENFIDAMMFLKSEKESADLIISNYSTLSWATFNAHSSGQDLKNGFDFFDELKKQGISLPFIMYTSMTSFPEFKSRIGQYIKYPKFSLVEKYTSQDLKNEIETICNPTQRACI